MSTQTIAGLILAGGLSTRMGGGDKSLLTLGPTSILERVMTRLARQVSPLVLNANGDPARFANTQLPIVPDSVPDFAGPLAGILAGMRWAAAEGCTHVVSVASDTPFFPDDLVAQLSTALLEKEAQEPGAHAIALAHSGGYFQPVFGLWPTALADDLENALVTQEIRKVMVWVRQHALCKVSFPHYQYGDQTLDPFFNINSPEDLSAAMAYLEALDA